MFPVLLLLKDRHAKCGLNGLGVTVFNYPAFSYAVHTWQS